MSDMFTCSVCGGVSYTILDFLNHKAQHAAPSAGIHCEFCQISYTRYITLKEHYRIKHKIVFSDDNSPNRSMARSRQYKRRKKSNSTSEQLKPVTGNEGQDVQQVDNGFVVMEKKSEFDDIVNSMGNTSEQITDLQHIAEKESGLETVQTNQGLESSTVIMMTSDNGNMLHSKALDTHPISHLLESSTDANFNSSAMTCDMPSSGAEIEEARLVQGENNPHEQFLFMDQNPVHVVMERSNHDSIMTNGICSLMTTSDIQDKSSGLPQGYEDFNITSENVQSSYGIQHPGDLCGLRSMEDDSSVHVIVEKSDSLPNHTLVGNGELMNLCGGDTNGNLISEQLDQTELITDSPLLDKATTDDFHFILLTDFVEGNSITYGKQAFKCLHCDYQSSWKSGLCRHMREEHSDTLSLHQAIQIKAAHTDSNRTVMKMSEYTAMQLTWKNKSAHPRSRGVEKQDLPGNFACPKCDKVFNRLRYLRKHQIVHRTDQKFLCDECGKAFKTRAYLNQHRKVHKKEAYSCNQCDFTSSINTVIHEHRQIHNKGCVLCDICGTAYFDKSTLAKHKSVHDMSRPFPCTYPGCTWRFRNEVMCRAHVRNHTTKGKFKCTVCGYVFRHKHHLQRHEEKMHGIAIPKTWSKKNAQEEKKLDIVEEITDTVNLIVDPDISSDHLNLQNALQTNQLVIATDSDGNTINYEVADIAMNVAYQTLLAGTDGQSVDTILIPHQANDCSHIVLQQETESITETVQ